LFLTPTKNNNLNPFLPASPDGKILSALEYCATLTNPKTQTIASFLQLALFPHKTTFVLLLQIEAPPYGFVAVPATPPVWFTLRALLAMTKNKAEKKKASPVPPSFQAKADGECVNDIDSEKYRAEVERHQRFKAEIERLVGEADSLEAKAKKSEDKAFKLRADAKNFDGQAKELRAQETLSLMAASQLFYCDATATYIKINEERFGPGEGVRHQSTQGTPWRPGHHDRSGIPGRLTLGILWAITTGQFKIQDVVPADMPSQEKESEMAEEKQHMEGQKENEGMDLFDMYVDGCHFIVDLMLFIADRCRPTLPSSLTLTRCVTIYSVPVLWLSISWSGVLGDMGSVLGIPITACVTKAIPIHSTTASNIYWNVFMVAHVTNFGFSFLPAVLLMTVIASILELWPTVVHHRVYLIATHMTSIEVFYLEAVWFYRNFGMAMFMKRLF
jgi:hypothetical protein